MWTITGMTTGAAIAMGVLGLTLLIASAIRLRQGLRNGYYTIEGSLFANLQAGHLVLCCFAAAISFLLALQPDTVWHQALAVLLTLAVVLVHLALGERHARYRDAWRRKHMPNVTP